MTDTTTKYRSVTSILSGGVPKPALTYWAAKRVAETAARETDWLDLDEVEAIAWLKEAPWREASDAADLGSMVHSYVEAANLGKELHWPLEVESHMRLFDRWVRDHHVEWEAAEMPVYNRTLTYAGTLDGICTVDGDRYILDVKTGKGVYPEVALQMAAYAHAEFCVPIRNHPGARQVTPRRGRRWYEWHGPETDEHPIPDVVGGLVVHLRPDALRVIPVDVGDAAWLAFRAACAVDHFQTMGKELLGDPITELTNEGGHGVSATDGRHQLKEAA